MPSIESLPSETILRILRYAAIDSVSNERHPRILLETAHVCRSWRGPSETLLWEEIEWPKSEDLPSLLAGTSSTGLATARLTLGGGGEFLRADKAALLLRSCRGVERLGLYFLDQFNLSALLVPGLEGECSRWAREDES